MHKYLPALMLFVAAIAAAGSAAPSRAAAPAVSGACARPAGNTGAGLYVACGRLNNPDGSEFRIRGVNRSHFDQNASAGVALAGANAARVFYPYQYGDAGKFASDIDSLLSNKIVPIAVAFTSVATTCSNEPAGLTAAIDRYVADKSTWASLNAKGILNIANEWGPAKSTLWRDEYIRAIAKLRAAGFAMPLMIDSGGCGQDPNDILDFGAAVAASDPQKNIILSFHLYGLTPDEPTMIGYYQKFAGLAKANPNLTVVIGEFGPGRGIGPSPSQITPAQSIAAAESTGLGWIAWAWDDNNLDGCKSNDQWFSMTTQCAAYSGQAAQLTQFGTEIIGRLKTLGAPKARVF